MTQAQDTKAALLAAAENAARAKGFDGFSYADLAQDVGIRKASIHYHFATKAILSVALMERYSTEIKFALHVIDSANKNANTKVSELIAIYRHALKDGHSLCLCVALSISRDTLCPEVLTAIQEFRAMITSWLAACFEHGRIDGSIPDVTDPTADAAATLALLEGAQLTARAAQDPDYFDRAVATLQSRLK